MSKPITKQELSQIEKTLDLLFGKLGLDVEFTKHFLDRVNDPRNVDQITPEELIKVYDSLYAKHGIKLSKMDDEIEELVKSASTDINIPLNIDYNFRTKKVELTAKTIMRKKGFKTPNKILNVESNVMSFKDYLKEEVLDEALITFGGKAYPKFGQVVILAGGAGSGKGFVKSNLLGVEGWTFDVDKLKELAIMSNRFAQEVKSTTGHDLKSFDLKKPENVSTLHDILGGMYKIDKKYSNTTYKSILSSDPSRLPNLIFDVTGKDIAKYDDIVRNVEKLGYGKNNIHGVWVLNDVEIAIQQNQQRDRTVPEDILISTHEGAAFTIKKLIDMGDSMNKYIGGDFYIVFNKAKVDSDLVKSNINTNKPMFKRKNGGQYIKKAEYIKIKSVGKAPISIDQFGDEMLAKIKSYIPKTIDFS